MSKRVERYEVLSSVIQDFLNGKRSHGLKRLGGYEGYYRQRGEPKNALWFKNMRRFL